MARIIAVVFIVCLFALTACSSFAHSSTQTALTGTTGINSASSESANGLSLSLSLDSTAYQPGQEIMMVIDEINTLSKTNNVSTSDKWPLSGLSLNPCGTNSFPFGVAIFQGDYTSADVSTATPLVIYDPSEPWPCPFIPAITAYDFLPSSDLAAEIIDNETNSEAFAMNQSVTATYYWTGGIQNVTRHDFDPGVYTVVAGDEWGNMVVLHFTVS